MLVVLHRQVDYHSNLKIQPLQHSSQNWKQFSVCMCLLFRYFMFYYLYYLYFMYLYLFCLFHLIRSNDLCCPTLCVFWETLVSRYDYNCLLFDYVATDTTTITLI